MLLLTTLCFGVLVTGISWNVIRVFKSVPEEDRSLLDKPALGFRLIWPLIKLCTHYVGNYLPQSLYLPIESNLSKAGLQFVIDARQFMASKIVCAVGVGLLGFIVLKSMTDAWPLLLVFFLWVGFVYPDLWLKNAIRQRHQLIVKDLPFFLDVIILSIEAGSNLTGGITQTIQKTSDSPLRTEFGKVLRDIRSGKNRATALREMSDRIGCGPLSNISNGMIQAERSGASLAPVLRAQADQLRSFRFLRAEKLAMEAPVKLLGPLVIFIFPTTFLVLAFVVISKAIQANVITWEPLVWAYYWPN